MGSPAKRHRRDRQEKSHAPAVLDGGRLRSEIRMRTINQKRWEKIQRLPLLRGNHKPDSQFCVMEAAAFIAGEEWTDHPESVPPTIGAFLRCWNDVLPTDADRDRLLKPFIPRVIGLPADDKIEEKRAVLLGDWVLRTAIPEILRSIHREDCQEVGERLAALPPMKNYKEIETAAHAAFGALADFGILATFETLDALGILATRADSTLRRARSSLAICGVLRALYPIVPRDKSLHKRLEQPELDLLEKMIGAR
jgi:hypothetical protein